MPSREALAHAVGHQELRVLGPAIGALGQPHLVLAQGVAVGRGGVLLVRRAIADDAVDDDQGRPVLGRAETSRARAATASQSLASRHPQHVPAIGREAGRDILAEGEVGVALDGDRVVVVDPAQVGELQMAGERGRLAGDALHHVAVAADRIDVVVEQREVRRVVARRQPALGDRHADAVAAALAERPGGGLDAGGEAVFRMAGQSCCRAGGSS